MLSEQHAEDGMVGLRSESRAQEGCTKQPTLGVDGIEIVLHYREHEEIGKVSICGTQCARGRCSESWSYSDEARPCCTIEGGPAWETWLVDASV